MPQERPKTSEVRSRTMRAVRSQDTGLEMRVRRLIHSLGYRYRLHAKNLPGKPDLVFRSRRTVIFIHGCFWHGHNCRRGARKPRDNADYWHRKIENNKLRDIKNTRLLDSVGWRVLVIWECETKDEDTIIKKLEEFMN